MFLVDSCELDLYPSSSESKSLGQDELNQLYVSILWFYLIMTALILAYVFCFRHD